MKTEREKLNGRQGRLFELIHKARSRGWHEEAAQLSKERELLIARIILLDIEELGIVGCVV